MSQENNERRNADVFGATEALSRVEYAKKETGMEIPIDAVPLPSNGVIYPKEHPLHNADKVEYMAMTAREEDILMSQAYMKNGTVITKLIESCIRDKSIQVNSLISGDRTAIMVAIRISGYGAEYVPEFKCPNQQCGFTNKLSLDLAELPIKRLTIDPVEQGKNLFSYTLPRSKKVVLFKFLTGAEEEAAIKEADMKQKKGIQQNNLVTSKLRSSIVSIDGDEKQGNIIKMIDNMLAIDSKHLRDYIDKNEPGIEMAVDFTCERCDHYGKIQLPMTSEFFWPTFE